MAKKKDFRRTTKNYRTRLQLSSMIKMIKAYELAKALTFGHSSFIAAHERSVRLSRLGCANDYS